ncbi:alpha-2 adrenergic receptor [Trichonephila clavipes]|nr:alpha-2 adrenergic receptor [Trichonephila clavipes]
MKIGNNGNLVFGPFDESTPCLMIVLMNCQTKLRINHLTAVKSVAILETPSKNNLHVFIFRPILEKGCSCLKEAGLLPLGSRRTQIITNFKLRAKSIPVKPQTCNISGDRLITKTIDKQRTGHYRGIKFDKDDRRTNRNWDNCLATELTPAHIFDCLAILAALQK